MNMLEAGAKNVIIISAGINDSSYFNGDASRTKTSPEDYRNNITRLACLAKKYTKHVFFIGFIPVDDSKLQPVPWNKSRSYSSENVRRFNSIMKEACKKEHVPFLDMFEATAKTNYKKFLDDGLHPTTEGHRKIFRMVLKFLKQNKAV